MTDRTGLAPWGWDAGHAAAFAARRTDTSAEPARVTGQDRDRWSVQTAAGPTQARIARATVGGPPPVTDDWVVVTPGPMPADPWSITDVLPRRTAMSRGAAGTGRVEQVLAANLDVVWIVHGLDTPLNARRLERYLTAAWVSGATSEVLLTKADLAADAAATIAEAEALAMGVPVRSVTDRDPASVAALREALVATRTYALLGPSGAGKSTLVNALASERVAATGAVRDGDRKGRHTTTRRELFLVAGGALLMDTPGLREFRVWSADEGLAQAFPEVDELTATCRFRDCRHEMEPGCAVRTAASDGRLDPDRLASYLALRREAAYLARRDDPLAQAAAVAQHKTALRTLKHHLKRREG